RGGHWFPRDSTDPRVRRFSGCRRRGRHASDHISLSTPELPLRVDLERAGTRPRPVRRAVCLRTWDATFEVRLKPDTATIWPSPVKAGHHFCHVSLMRQPCSTDT